MLAKIEDSMSDEYCKATAFCLRARKSEGRFSGLEKYRTPLKTDWAEYLDAFVRDYYNEVYVR